MGIELGGTIAIPVLAVYTLKNVFMLPIFVLSAILAFVGLWVVKQRTLLYGRDELLVAMGIGSQTCCEQYLHPLTAWFARIVRSRFA